MPPKSRYSKYTRRRTPPSNRNVPQEYEPAKRIAREYAPTTYKQPQPRSPFTVTRGGTASVRGGKGFQGRTNLNLPPRITFNRGIAMQNELLGEQNAYGVPFMQYQPNPPTVPQYPAPWLVANRGERVFRGGKGFQGQTILNAPVNATLSPQSQYWRDVYQSYRRNPADEYRIPNPAITPQYYGMWVNPETNLVENMSQQNMSQYNYPYYNPNATTRTTTQEQPSTEIKSKTYAYGKPGGFDVPNPETEGVLESPAAPIEYAPTDYGYGYGGGYGGGGYSYSYAGNPYAQYQKGYPMRAIEPNVRPAFRTPGTSASNYYSQPQTLYPSRWLQLLTSWRI